MIIKIVEIFQRIRKFLLKNKNKGTTAIEYTVGAAFIAAVAIPILTKMRDHYRNETAAMDEEMRTAQEVAPVVPAYGGVNMPPTLPEP